MALVLNGTTGVQDNSGAFVAGTAVAPTSGTSIDFTSIPSWVKKITVMFNDISTNGSSIIQAQIGSGSVTNTGYLSNTTTSSSNASSTTGFVTTYTMAANFGVIGTMTISLITGSTYIASGSIGLTASGTVLNTGSMFGNVALGGVLDRVRITTVGGTDTFDAGSINILYE